MENYWIIFLIFFGILLARKSTAAQVNLALGQPAFQSSTYTGTAGITPSANLAVDGNADTNFMHGHCTHTALNDVNTWLVVDLGRLVLVGSVAVTNRGDCCASRLNGFIVGVSTAYTGTVVRGSYPLCGQYPGTTAAGARLNVTCGADPLAGRYVIIQLPVTNLGPLTICELEVYGKVDLASCLSVMKDTIITLYGLYGDKLLNLIENNYGLQYSIMIGVYLDQGKGVLSNILQQFVSAGNNPALQQLDATACWNFVSALIQLKPTS